MRPFNCDGYVLRSSIRADPKNQIETTWCSSDSSLGSGGNISFWNPCYCCLLHWPIGTVKAGNELSIRLNFRFVIEVRGRRYKSIQ